ncbi:hypothetical protein QQ045_005042 [Rhodiola kirilowii]
MIQTRTKVARSRLEMKRKTRTISQRKVLSKKAMPTESMSPQTSSSSEKQKSSSSSVNKPGQDAEFKKLYYMYMLKMTDSRRSHAKKLYNAVKNMEQVKMRGVPFQIKAMKYLRESSFDDFFVECKTEEEKWEWLKHLA